MNNYKKLDYITRGINAANGIRSIKNSTKTETRDTSDKPDTLSMLSQMLDVIAQYYPDDRNQELGDRLHKSTIYGETYRSLKQHVRTLKSSDRMERDDLIKTLKIIKPVVDTRKKQFIEKLVKIHEILNS
ncbi:MAG: hypothetical protein GX660_00785 [Clostridiaceae bacterium]|nr:hypothetical protein [Clostridiaceae bacterium]